MRIHNHNTSRLSMANPQTNQGLKILPPTSYSLVTKQALFRGLLTKRVIPTLEPLY